MIFTSAYEAKITNRWVGRTNESKYQRTNILKNVLYCIVSELYGVNLHKSSKSDFFAKMYKIFVLCRIFEPCPIVLSPLWLPSTHYPPLWGLVTNAIVRGEEHFAVLDTCVWYVCALHTLLLHVNVSLTMHEHCKLLINELVTDRLVDIAWQCIASGYELVPALLACLLAYLLLEANTVKPSPDYQATRHDFYHWILSNRRPTSFQTKYPSRFQVNFAYPSSTVCFHSNSLAFKKARIL